MVSHVSPTNALRLRFVFTRETIFRRFSGNFERINLLLHVMTEKAYKIAQEFALKQSYGSMIFDIIRPAGEKKRIRILSFSKF